MRWSPAIEPLSPTEGEATELTIGIRADWQTGPLWVSADDDFPDPHDADEIQEVVALSDDLREAVAVWDERFQATSNEEAPQDSAFADDDDEAAFVAQGEILARRLRTELPSSIVVRYSGINHDWAVVETE